MENKTQIIYENLQSIREALYGNEDACIPIDQVAEDVARLASDSSQGGFTTAFVFSTNIKSNRPTGGSLNPATGLVEGVEGWTQTVTTSNVDDLLMSFAVFNPEGELTTDWSVPVNLKGKGVAGKDGEQGPVGPQGLPGEKGESGVSYRTVSVYTTTDSAETVPSRPKGGHWDMKTNTLSLPVTDDGTRWWANVDDEPNPKRFIWTSNVTFQDNGNPMGKWSIPFRITGEDGKNGADGRVIEFIYRLLPNYDTYVVLRDFLSKPENKLPSINETDYIPSVNDSLNVGTEWEDRPSGIDTTMQVEVVCSRVRNSVDVPWSEWSNCAIWSKWGEDGMDGDGVEYIYLVTPAEINGVPTTSGHVKDTLVPTYSLEGDYQNDEFCFNDEWGFEGYDWTDEPRDVGPGEPMEWVMVRKQKDGVWQSFSDPALWATYSEDGVSYITSFVFTRATIAIPPTQPKGGDYLHPYPTADGSETGYRDENWHDSVPSDGNLPVWMSTRTFCSDYRYNDDDWSEPKMLADTPDFQVEYTAYTGEISREKLDKFEGESTEVNEEKWRTSQLSKYNIEWGDDTKIKDPIWMITATRHGGEWSDWTISKIKGEKGDKGDPGSSVRIEGQFETLDQLKEAWSDYVNTGSLDKFHFESKDGVINPGDGWYVVEDGMLYSYSGGWSKDEDDSRFETYWFGTPIKGEPGDSFYMYVAYCNENNANATVDLIGPGKYIGVKVTDKPLSETEQKSWSTYTWTKWEGEDGFGQEQIFLATSTNLGYNPEKVHLPLPTDNSQTAELLPIHTYGSDAYPHDKWSDTPVTPTPEYPFCWVATRKCQGSKFENWKGTDGTAALYSRWSYDGVSNVYVDLSNDLAVIPMEDGKVDPDFTDVVQTVVRVWVGDEQIPSTDFVVTGNNVVINGATVTLNLSALNSSIKTIPLNVELGGKTYSVNWKILQTDVAYELTPKTYSIKKYVTGDKVGQLELDELTVEIWKWSDNKWVASNVPLFAYIVYTDGREEILSTLDGRITISKNGTATVNLKGLLNVASIKIYVVAQNENGEYLSNGEQLSFENITVVADGKDGEDGKDGQDGQDGQDGAPGQDGKDGIDGKDGPGIEYVYIVTGPDANASTLHNELLSSTNDERYQNDDFYPNKNNGYLNFDWTDDPQNVSAEKPFEWVSKRKKSNGVWGEFSLPVIWAKYTSDGKDAFEYKTSYVFTRATSTPNPPIGGRFADGLPENNNIWSDTVPQNGEGEVWMSYRMFRSDDAHIDDWSAPTQMTDTSKFEVIYGVSTANLSLLPELPITEGISNYNGWYDKAEAGVEFHYMATATYSNSKWSNWTVSKIKGEKGDKGEDGKSVTIKGKFNTVSDLQLAWNKYFDDPVNAGFVYPLLMGDGYLVDGELWVYDGDASSFVDSWNNVGKIQGEPGQSVYMYIRYSNDGGQTMLNEGSVGKYIGVYVGTTDLTEEQKSKPTTYNPWTKWTGDDGWGWEQIFKITSDNNPPYIEMDQQTLSESELVELGWSDKPVSVSETNKYVWYLFRKSNSYWQGETIQNGKVYAALFDHWTTDGPQGPQGDAGAGILSIVEFYLTSSLSSGITVGTEGWKQDEPEHKLDSTNRYLWNYTQTTYTDGRVVNTDPIIIGGYGEDAISISLSNESDKMAWFQSGESQKNTMSCTVSAVRNGERLEVKHVSCKLPEGIVLQDTQRLGESLTYNLYAPAFLENGVYNCVIKFTVNGELFERTLTIIVENLKDLDVDVIMDQTITVDSTVKTIAPHTEVEWFILGVSWWEVAEQKIYSRKQVEVTGVRAVINGAPASWSVSELKIGDSVINRYSSTNPDLELYTWNEEMGYILIQFSAIPDNILTNGIVQGSITFDVEGKTVVKPVIFNCSYNDKYDFEITPNTVKKGETVSVKLSYVLKNGEGQVYRNYKRVDPGSNIVYDNFAGVIDVKVNNAYVTPVNNAIELTAQDDVTFEFYKHGSEELIGMQTLSCLDIQTLDYYSIETDSPFVSVTETALVGNGETVNGPINVYIKHHAGNTVTVSNNIPENCYVQVNGIVPPVLTAGNTLDFGTSAFSYLYKGLEPIKLELYNNDKELLDSLTIEKTVVYPDPIIYPAGEFNRSKSFIMNFNQIPYVYVQTEDSIEYYVGNKNILEKYYRTEINLNGSVLATGGTDPRDLCTEEGDLLWNKMDSFEAVYADIGIFKQALVGPLVFYKDYVFSQMGVFKGGVVYKTDPLGSSVKYEIEHIFTEDESHLPGASLSYDFVINAVMFCRNNVNNTSTYASYDNIWSYINAGHWVPNYLLNAKTGEFTLNSTSSNKATINIGDTITIGGDDSAISIVDLTTQYDGSLRTMGDLTLGKDGEQVISYKGSRYGYFGVGHGNSPDCYNVNGSGFAVISNNTSSNVPWDTGYCYSHNNTPALTLSSDTGKIALNILSGQVAGLRPYLAYEDELHKLVEMPSCFWPSVFIIGDSCEIILPDVLTNPFTQTGDTFEIWKANTSSVTITVENNGYFNWIGDNGASTKQTHNWTSPGGYRFINTGARGWYVIFQKS